MPISDALYAQRNEKILSAVASSSLSPSQILPSSSSLVRTLSLLSSVARNVRKHSFGKKSLSLTNLMRVSSSSSSRTRRSRKYCCRCDTSSSDVIYSVWKHFVSAASMGTSILQLCLGPLIKTLVLLCGMFGSSHELLRLRRLYCVLFKRWGPVSEDKVRLLYLFLCAVLRR